MKKFLWAALLCVCIGGSCRAQQNPADAPASKEDVERYFQVMHSRDMISKMMDALTKPMHEMIHQEFLKSQDKLPPDFEARLNKRMDDAMKNIPWDDIFDSMIPVYQKHLTKGDIDALVVFYGTPTGQKLMRELPAITAESMQQMMPVLRQSIESMQKGIQEDIAAMLREHESKNGASDSQRN